MKKLITLLALLGTAASAAPAQRRGNAAVAGTSYVNLTIPAQLTVNIATVSPPFSIIFTRTAINCGFFAPTTTVAYGPSFGNPQCNALTSSAEAILTQLDVATNGLVPYHVLATDANTGATGSVTLAGNLAVGSQLTLNLRINVSGPNSGSHDYGSGDVITTLEAQQTIRLYPSLASDICAANLELGHVVGNPAAGCPVAGGTKDGQYTGNVNWIISV